MPRAGGRDELSKGLRDLRQVANLTGSDAASRSGSSQSKISRVENGVSLPTPEFVDVLCRIYEAGVDDRRRLISMARDVQAGNRRVVLRRSVAPFQKQIGRIVRQSALVRTFVTVGLPGLLQTADYARALFHSGGNLTSESAEAGVAARLANQAVLDDHDSGRQFSMIIAEGALGWALCPPTSMAEQIDHVAVATHRPNARIGIIPWGTPAPALPLHGWEMYDDRLVIAGTTTATAMLDDALDIAAYGTLFAEMAALAVFDADARDLLAHVAAAYRKL